MIPADVQKVQRSWGDVARFMYVPHNEQEYQALVEFLDALIDIVGEDEKHPLASMMEIVGVLIEKYEDEHVPEITVI